MGEPWRSTAPATTPPWGDGPQVAPTGGYPLSAGDPLLLPRVTVSPATDLFFGSIYGYKVPLAEGAFGRRPKVVEWITWVIDPSGGLSQLLGAVLPSYSWSFVVFTTPTGVEPIEAFATGSLIVYDSSFNPSSLPVVRGSFTPPLYVPAETDFWVIAVERITQDLPTSATRLTCQWRLL